MSNWTDKKMFEINLPERDEVYTQFRELVSAYKKKGYSVDEIMAILDGLDKQTGGLLKFWLKKIEAVLAEVEEDS